MCIYVYVNVCIHYVHVCICICQYTHVCLCIGRMCVHARVDSDGAFLAILPFLPVLIDVLPLLNIRASLCDGGVIE